MSPTVDRYEESKAVIPPDILRPIPVQDSRNFFARLIDSMRVRWEFDPKTHKLTVEAHGGAEF